MREFAKSMVGLSWAASLFGVDQFSKLISPASTSGDVAIATFDELRGVMQGRLSEPVAGWFRAGDRWQRRMVDALFDAASLDPRAVMKALDPRRTRRPTRTGSGRSTRSSARGRSRRPRNT
jgi:hypothetical protein